MSGWYEYSRGIDCQIKAGESKGMEFTEPPCEWDRRFRCLSYRSKSVQIGPGSLKVDRRRIPDFLNAGGLTGISLAELSRVKRDEFAYHACIFILPSVTISSTYEDREIFYKKVKEASFLWYKQLKKGIRNRGLRVVRGDLSKIDLVVLFSGIWVINGTTSLRSLDEMKERLFSDVPDDSSCTRIDESAT